MAFKLDLINYVDFSHQINTIKNVVIEHFASAYTHVHCTHTHTRAP